MKIAIDCRLIGQSGIGTYIVNIVRHIIDVSNTDFVLIGNKDVLAPYASRKNCKIIDCQHKSFTLKELFRFPTKKVNECDAFFTPNFNVPLGIKVPIFCTIHDVVFFDIEGICSTLGKVIRWMYMKRALAISKGVFTVSNFSKQRIKALFHHKGDIFVLHNGISQELKDYRAAQTRVTKEDYIVYLGNLKKYKGIKDLIAAYRKAQMNEGFHSKLYIIGRIDSRSRDEELIQMMEQHDENIRFITDANNQQVFQLLAGARALVSPSHYEGFGIPPLEAMYLGTPALVSNIPTHREVYEGTPAIFFHVGDVDDLTEKLLHLPSETCQVDDIVEERYNFKKTAQQALKTIHDSCLRTIAKPCDTVQDTCQSSCPR